MTTTLALPAFAAAFPPDTPVVPINRLTAADTIRSFRTTHGLSQQDLVDHLHALAITHTGRGIGLDRQMVSKWERGTKQPSPAYRKLLALLFTATPAEPVAPQRIKPATGGYNSRVYAHRFGTTRPHTLAGGR